ncbi:MAG TPA: formate dehydrogenase accessory sulfurtransferase FdhD [bacterium]|nr:formate dehydrogenase accessory sulfurtransferase FdhD [bacterium]
MGDASRDPATASVRTSTTRRRVGQVQEGVVRVRDDALVVEEPLEIRLYPGDGEPYLQVSVTMRTPGHDFELAAGFLFTEGILQNCGQVDHINYCADRTLEQAQRYNIVNVYLRPGVPLDPERLRRNFYTTSSCGVCGKASIEAIQVRGLRPVADDGFAVDGEVFARMGDVLRRSQAIFDKTGGLHAAALFDPSGGLLAVREDVGRHNAVDKLVGHAFLDRALPLSRHLLMVSGRASFEIMQKAAAAGVPVVAAVSAPSSLACDVARAFGMTLVGFARGDRFCVYAGAHRIRQRGQPLPGID